MLDVAGDGGEDYIAEGGGEGTSKNCPIAATDTSCRRIHRHLELAHKIDAQERAVNLTLDEIKTNVVRTGIDVAEDQLESRLCTSGNSAPVCRFAAVSAWPPEDVGPGMMDTVAPVLAKKRAPDN